MRNTLRAHNSTAYSKVRYSPSPLYTLDLTNHDKNASTFKAIWQLYQLWHL